jgi:sec-independent protein translocase protein TatC
LRQRLERLEDLIQQLIAVVQTQKPPKPWYEERWEDADKVLRYANDHKAYTLIDEMSYNLQRKKIKLEALYASDPVLLGERDIILKPYSPSLFGWFLINVEVSLLAGLIVAAPFILYQIWAFVVPALTPTEKRYALKVIPFSILLFAGGVIFGFYALPVAVKFLVSFVPDQAERLLDFKLYFGFLLKICLGLGLCFQLPLVMLFLAAIGLVSPSFLTSHWRHAIVVMFVIAAVITPTWDPVNMSIVAAPLVALYFLSIVLVQWMVRKREREAEAASDGLD